MLLASRQTVARLLLGSAGGVVSTRRVSLRGVPYEEEYSTRRVITERSTKKVPNNSKMKITDF